MKRPAPLVALLLAWGAAPARAQLAPGDAASKFDLATMHDQLATPTDLAALPDRRVVIIEQGGGIHVRRADGTLQRDVASVPGMLDSSSEKGLLGVVPDPAFGQNHVLYFYASVGDTANKHKVLRATMADDNSLTWTATPIVDTNLQGPANHDGGGLIVHKGFLYVSVGDTGANATPPVNKYGSCLDRANGKILRVNLDGTTPADNPLVAEAAVTGCSDPTAPFVDAPPDKRIYAWGMRNAFRFWIDPATDRMWIGDVGEVTKEEISVTAPVGAGWTGAHLGYPFHEGSTGWGQTWDGVSDCNAGMKPARACTPPAFDYEHAAENCVIGGLVPDGCAWPAEYRAKYFFGDHGSGLIYTLDLNANRSGIVAGSLQTFANVGSMTSFRMGPDGGLWVTVDGNGSVVRILPRNAAASCAADAGVAPAPRPGADAAAGGNSSSSGGCSCSTSGSPGPGGAGVALIALVLVGASCGRRRGRADRRSCRTVRPPAPPPPMTRARR
jgi:MYXO-CTERM domain-containing protein